MSDHVAVFNLGRIEQIGTPAEIYRHPASSFVAGFVGTSNVVSGDLAIRLRGAPDPFTVRPERIALLPSSADASALNGERRAHGHRAGGALPRRAHPVRPRPRRRRAAHRRRAEREQPLGFELGAARHARAALLGARRRSDAAESHNRTIDKGEHMRTGKLAIAAVAVVAALGGRRVWGRQRRGQLGRATRQARCRRRRAEHHRLGRLRGRRLDRPIGRLGPSVRRADRLQDQREDRQHERRDGAADEHR